MNGRIDLDAFRKAADEQGVKTKAGAMAHEGEVLSPYGGERSGLMEVGRVSIGEIKTNQNGKQYPSAVDYFIFRSRFAGMVQQRHGDRPKQVPIFFHSDDFNQVCFERLELRDKAGRLFAFGDGKQFGVYSVKTGEYIYTDLEKKPNLIGDALDFVRDGISDEQKRAALDWSQVLTLRFIIKDVPILGYWQFSTKGVKTTIQNLREMYDQTLATFGTVRFFPFDLSVKIVKSNKPGDSRQYPVVEILPAISLESGLKIAEYIKQNPDFNPARLAGMDFRQDNQAAVRQLLASDTSGKLRLAAGDENNLSPENEPGQ